MRKGDTLAEVLIIVTIVGLAGLVGWKMVTKITTERTCNQHGYLRTGTGFSRYCVRLVNGQTEVVHVDSLR